jgi:TM2 domain-containing membrane protein YozV
MTALSLGIIPGMGQIYAGNIKSGIATFILNGFFIGT